MKLRNIIGIAAVAALLPALAACSTGTETPAPAETSAVSAPVEETATATPTPTAAAPVALDPKTPGQIQGGVASLTNLPIPSGVPESWQVLNLKNLTIAAPSTFTVSPLATPDTLSYEDLVNRAIADVPTPDGGIMSSPQIFSVQTGTNSDWDGQWKNPEGAESYKLEIPGAVFAAVYCSEATLGGEGGPSQLNCRIEAKGQDSTVYVVDLYTQSGNLEYVKQVAGTMSIA